MSQPERPPLEAEDFITGDWKGLVVVVKPNANEDMADYVCLSIGMNRADVSRLVTSLYQRLIKESQ